MTYLLCIYTFATFEPSEQLNVPSGVPPDHRVCLLIAGSARYQPCRRGKYTCILTDNHPGKVSPEKNSGEEFPLAEGRLIASGIPTFTCQVIVSGHTEQHMHTLSLHFNVHGL